MTIKKNLAIAMIVVLVLIAGSVTAFANSPYKSPAEAFAGLSGNNVESVISERAESGKTFGTMANEAGLLEQFKAELTEMKKNRLAERVAAGTMTQEQANEMITRMEQNQANCDGTGAGYGQNAGEGSGLGFGQGAALCNGQGAALGNGQGAGKGGPGMGNGLRDGSCGK